MSTYTGTFSKLELGSEWLTAMYNDFKNHTGTTPHSEFVKNNPAWVSPNLYKLGDWTEFDEQRKLNKPLQPYQNRVLKKIQDPTLPGLVVAHGTGTGKTRTSIEVAKKLKMPTQIIPPAALQDNYQKEIAKWVGRQPSNWNITSQQKVSLRGLPVNPNSLQIIDEGQHARELQSQLHQQLQQSPAKKRLILSATPIFNHPTDLSNLVNLAAQKNILPTNKTEFNKEYFQPEEVQPGFIQKLFGVKPGIQYKLKNKEQLRKVLNRYVDYQPGFAEGFPSVSQEEVKVPMGKKQMDIYKTIMGQAPWWVRWKVKSGLPPGKGELESMRAFLGGVRQVSNTTQGFTTRPEELESPKIQKAFEYLKNQLHNDPTYKAVVYSNYLRSGIDPYKQYLQEYNIPYGEFSGNITPAVRNKLVRDYNANKIKALLVSSAGSEGLDLKGTRLVQLLEPHFNEEKEKQIIGRGARFQSHAMLPPEKQNVLVQRYLARPQAGLLDRILGRSEVKGADEYIRQMASQKDQLNRQVMGLLNPEEKKKPRFTW